MSAGELAFNSDGPEGVLDGMDNVYQLMPEADHSNRNGLPLLYGAALRCLAQARLMARREIGDHFDANTWQPTPDALLKVATPEARRMARYMTMASHARSYMATARQDDKKSELKLREDQSVPFDLVLNFFTGKDKDLDLRTALENVADKAYFGIGTGGGKTAIAAKILEALGIGKKIENSEEPPLKALYLVPTKTLVAQASHEDEAVSDLKKFAPGLRITRYYQEEKDFSGDAVVMTYHSFREAAKAGWLTKNMIDIILADEAHNLLGRGTRQIFEDLTQSEISVIGCTASTAYSTDKKLSDILGRELIDISVRELIDMGVVSSVRLLAVATESAISSKTKRGDFTEEELKGLSHSPNRNKQILEWVQYFVDEGKQVLGWAMKGDTCWHARHLAELVSEQYTFNEETGVRRPIIAKAIGSFLSSRECDEMLAEWEEGKIDVIFAVDKLKEGWNSKRVGAVVDAAPTASEVMAEQKFGRGMRHNSDGSPTVHVSLIDHYSGFKIPYTPWHVLGEEVIDSDRIIGAEEYDSDEEYGLDIDNRPHEDNSSGVGYSPALSGLNNNGKQGKASNKSLDRWIERTPLPGHLYKQLMPRNMVLGDLFVGCEVAGPAREIERVGAGWIPFLNTVPLWQGYSASAVLKILEKQGLAHKFARGSNGARRYVSEEAKSFLEAYKFPQSAPKDMRPIQEAVELVGAGPSVIFKIAEELGFQPEEYMTRNRCLSYHFSTEQIRLIKARKTELAQMEEGDQVLSRLAKELHVSLPSILLFMSDNSLLAYSGYTSKNTRALIVKADVAERIKQHYGQLVISPHQKTIDMIAEATGENRVNVDSWIELLGMRGRLKKGRIINPKTGRSSYPAYFEFEDAKMLATAMLAYRTRPGPKLDRQAFLDGSWNEEAEEAVCLLPDEWQKRAEVLARLDARRLFIEEMIKDRTQSVGAVATTHTVADEVVSSGGHSFEITAHSDDFLDEEEAADRVAGKVKHVEELQREIICSKRTLGLISQILEIPRDALKKRPDLGPGWFLDAHTTERIKKYTAQLTPAPVGWLTEDAFWKQAGLRSLEELDQFLIDHQSSIRLNNYRKLYRIGGRAGEIKVHLKKAEMLPAVKSRVDRWRRDQQQRQ